MDELRDAIGQLDHSGRDEEQVHREIYLHIVQNILPSNGGGPFTNRPANIVTAAYAVRRHLYPTLFWERTELLLDLLTHIEWIRACTVSTARDMLLWNRYYTEEYHATRRKLVASPPKVGDHKQEVKHLDAEAEATLLSDDELKKVARVADERKDESVRTIYIHLALDFIALHLYRLWPLDDVARLTYHTNDYFPPARNPGEKNDPPLHRSRRHFHRDLHEDERQDLVATAKQCDELFTKAREWLKTRLQSSSSSSSSSRTSTAIERAYLDAIPPLVDAEELVHRCEFYVSTVEGMVSSLRAVLEEPDREAKAHDDESP